MARDNATGADEGKAEAAADGEAESESGPLTEAERAEIAAEAGLSVEQVDRLMETAGLSPDELRDRASNLAAKNQAASEPTRRVISMMLDRFPDATDAGDVAELLGVSRRAGLDRLTNLEDDGLVVSEKVGAKARVFRPNMDEFGDEMLAALSTRVSDGESDSDSDVEPDAIPAN